MMKNLASTASLIMLVAISGQAFARATGSNTRYSTEATAPSDRQVVGTLSAFDDPAMVTQIVEPDAYTYHGGPKYND